MSEHRQVQGQNQGQVHEQGHGMAQIQIMDDGQGQLPIHDQVVGLDQNQGLVQMQGYGQEVGQDQGLGQGLVKMQDYGQGAGQGQGLGQGLVQMQGYGQGSVQVEELWQDIEELEDYGQGVSQDQGLGQGQVQMQGVSQDQGLGQGQVQMQGAGQDLGLGQGQVQMQGAGQDQMQGAGQDLGLGQGQVQMQGAGQDLGLGQGQVQMQGAGQDLGLGQGQVQMQGAGQDLGLGQGQVQMQGAGQDQGLGQGLVQMQDYGLWQGLFQMQGAGQDQDQGLGQGLVQMQDYGQGAVQEQELWQDIEELQDYGQGVSQDQGLGQGLVQMQDYGQGAGRGQDMGLGQGLVQMQGYGQESGQDQGLGQGLVQMQGYGQGAGQEQGLGQGLLQMQGYGQGAGQDQGIGQGVVQMQDHGQGAGQDQGLGQGVGQMQDYGQGAGQDQDYGQGTEHIERQMFVLVDVAQGTLRGRKILSNALTPYYSFQGIPFAKPPVGSLRFKDPEPLTPWLGIRDALQDGPYCLQGRYLQGSEDCLYLNVFAPEVPETESEERLMPVMVYIHCCGYLSHNRNDCGPDNLIDEGVVMVTIHYRLGVFGFLCLDIVEAPGNVGLKDQVAALCWVQQNITLFGGDRSNVTIFGFGLGGVCVSLHMLSPMSKGLFHRAISQSGTALNPWGWRTNSREMAFRLGALLGNHTKDPRALVDVLKRVDAQHLVKLALKCTLTKRDKSRLVVFPFVPTPEVYLPGVERFLPGTPLELLEAGRYHAVPYMTGVTSHEGMLTLIFLRDIQWHSLPPIKWNFHMTVLPELRIPADCITRDAICGIFKDVYLRSPYVGRDNLAGFIDMYSDVLFGEGIHTTVKLMAKFNKSPVYYFCFSYDGQLSVLKRSMGLNYPGVCHADMLGYLFNTTDTNPYMDHATTFTRARVVKMWTNFAETGNPTPVVPVVTTLLPIKWQRHTTANPCYLDIGRELRVRKNFRKERMALFEWIYSRI